jgi:hypothetical protein
VVREVATLSFFFFVSGLDHSRRRTWFRFWLGWAKDVEVTFLENDGIINQLEVSFQVEIESEFHDILAFTLAHNLHVVVLSLWESHGVNFLLEFEL